MSNRDEQDVTPDTLYFIFRGRRTITVSREEWERTWYDWWRRTHRYDSEQD
jgi:hypothetical protein